MTLTLIVEPSENHRDLRGIHLKVFNDPSSDHVCEFVIRSH